jgi:hypothetical protein
MCVVPLLRAFYPINFMHQRDVQKANNHLAPQNLPTFMVLKEYYTQ